MGQGLDGEVGEAFGPRGLVEAGVEVFGKDLERLLIALGFVPEQAVEHAAHPRLLLLPRRGVGHLADRALGDDLAGGLVVARLHLHLAGVASRLAFELEIQRQRQAHGARGLLEGGRERDLVLSIFRRARLNGQVAGQHQTQLRELAQHGLHSGPFLRIARHEQNKNMRQAGSQVLSLRPGR